MGKNKKKKKNMNNTEKDAEKINIPMFVSSDIFLDVALKEYEREEERGRSLNERSGVLISATVLLLTFYLPNVKIKDVIYVSKDSFVAYIPYFSLLILYLITLISILIALIMFIKVISLKKYSRIEFKDLSNQGNNKVARDIIRYSLIEKYCEMAENNILTHDKKAELFQQGIIALFIVAISIVLSSVIAQLIL